MTITLQVVKLLADGKPRSFDQIAEELGISKSKVRNAVNWLQQTEMTSNAFVYTLTAKGRERSKHVPLAAREVQHRYQLRHLNEPRPERVNPVKSSVCEVMKNQPALHSVWGA